MCNALVKMSTEAFYKMLLHKNIRKQIIIATNKGVKHERGANIINRIKINSICNSFHHIKRP